MMGEDRIQQAGDRIRNIGILECWKNGRKIAQSGYLIGASRRQKAKDSPLRQGLPACGGADQPEVGKRRPGLDWVIAWRLQKVSTWKFIVFFMALWYQMLYSSKNCAPQFLNENLIGGFAGVLDS
jgi:hypothetical protein